MRGNRTLSILSNAMCRYICVEALTACSLKRQALAPSSIIIGMIDHHHYRSTMNENI